MEKRAQLFDVCIVCALYEEAEAVLSEFSTRCHVSFTKDFSSMDRYEYRYTSILNNRGEPLTVLVTWLSDSGPTQTGLDIKPFLHEFRPRFIAMTGFCAGYKNKVKWGDLIVAQYAYFYEAGKVMSDSEGLSRHLQEMKAAASTSQVLHYTKGFTDWKEPVKKMKVERLKRELKDHEEPRCVIGPMASGTAVRQDDPFPWLRENYDRNTVGLDMEAATFYQALRALSHIHGLVVKGVCDYANMNKKDTYHDYAARASAIYLLCFMQEYITEQTMPRRDGQSGVWNVPCMSNPHSLTLGQTSEPRNLYEIGNTEVPPLFSNASSSGFSPQNLVKEKLDINECTSDMQKDRETDFQVSQQEKLNAISTETPAAPELLTSSFIEEAGKQKHNRQEKPIGVLQYALDAHTGEVYSLAWSPNGRYLASAGADKTIFIVEYATQRVFQLPREHTKTIFTLSWSPDETLLCSGGKDCVVHVWDIAARKKWLTYRNLKTGIRLLKFMKDPPEILSVAWSPDGHWIASGGDDCTVHVWNARSGERYYQYKGHLLGHDEAGLHAAASISSVVWSPDGRRLATASCKFDDILDESISVKTLKKIPGFSQFLSWNEYAKIHIWDALTGDQVRLYPGHKIGVTALAWSTDGTHIASASKDRTVQVWKPATLRSSTQYIQSAIFKGHTDQVKAVAWSPDSMYIASAGKDKTVQIWKASTGEIIYIYRGHTECVRALAWSGSGDIIASAGDDGTVHLWKAPQKPTIE